MINDISVRLKNIFLCNRLLYLGQGDMQFTQSFRLYLNLVFLCFTSYHRHIRYPVYFRQKWFDLIKGNILQFNSTAVSLQRKCHDR